jgi:soluble lytic murein transglycosylase-like protein
MTTEATSLFRKNRAPALAAALVICFGFIPNTIASATNTANIASRPSMATPHPARENGEVLGHDDAALYRGIFAAQAKTQWIEADAMIARLGDKRLLGHVLADRYLRRPSTLAELQAWLAAYQDLPEAEYLYQQARMLPGGNNAKLARPLAANVAGGHGYGYGTASGFRNKQHRTAVSLSAISRRYANRIENALRQGNTDSAKTLLETALQQTTLPRDQLIALQARLAAGFLYNGDANEAHSLTDVSYMQDDARALWINGLSAFKLSNYAGAATSFVALANQDDLADVDHAASAFWAYRALKRNGDKDEAYHWLKEAASEPRSFYGLLASNLTGHSAEDAWSWYLPALNKRTTDILASLPAGGRALALAQVSQNDLAERELQRLNPQGRRNLQEAMLALAEKGHMASLAMKLGGMSLDEDGRPYDGALYPVPRWQPAGGFRVERALIYALMRHESQFDPMAVSSQGACGLMQLMPATAHRMNGSEANHRQGGECPDQFFDPATNLGLGQRYVRQLADQPMIGDNLLLLLAAYNGGPGRLSQRTDTNDDADPLLFMESLPSQETHDYVQQVMIQYWTYCARLHQPLKSLDQLARGQWPRFALSDTAPIRETAAEPIERFDVASNVTVH